MGIEDDVNEDPVNGDLTDGLGLRELEQQIIERMTKLLPAAEEYCKLQILLDTIDGREVLPVPDFLVGRVPEVSRPDEQLRRQARERTAQRVARGSRYRRRR